MKILLKKDVGTAKAGEIVSPASAEYKRIPVKNWEIVSVSVEDQKLLPVDFDIIEE